MWQALGERTDNVPGSTKPVGKKMEDIYKKMTQRQHILARPDTYVGSMEEHTEQQVVYTATDGFLTREITFVPGLYKIFDEILVNAADHKQRHGDAVDEIRVVIDQANGVISVSNTGPGIPIEMHKDEQVGSCMVLCETAQEKRKGESKGERRGGTKLCCVLSRLSHFN